MRGGGNSLRNMVTIQTVTVLAIYVYTKYNKIQVNDSNIYHKGNNKHPFQ